MNIREATPGDVETISGLVCELSEKFISQELTADGAEHLLASMNPDAIKKYIDSGYKYHVAEINQQVVGVVGVKDNRHLFHLFVAEQYQRKGIARNLWKTAMETCLSNGNPGEFTVNSSKYALDVYVKLGFVAQSGPVVKNGVVFIPMKMRRRNV